MSQRGITAAAGLLIVLNVCLVATTAWMIWKANQPKPIVESPAPQADADTSDNLRTVTSAKGAFSITFPTGWDKVLRVMDSDHFVVVGSEQPEIDADRAAKVQDVVTFDSSGPVVFEAIADEDLPAPEGEASDVLIGKGSSLLSGRKYIHKYIGNNLSGQRSNGDMDYIYSFPLGGDRELRVTYRIYADDTTNNSQTVENIVRSIRKLK